MVRADDSARHHASLPWLTLFTAGILLLLAFRLAALKWNATDLFFDEAQYWYWSLEPAFGYYSKPPLIAWIIRVATDTCGISEFCIRLPSAFLHTMTAVAIFALGTRFYDVRTGAIAGLVYATLPGVSFSSSIISTDVPLLLFWAIALYAFATLIGLSTADNNQTPANNPPLERPWWPAIMLGVASGIGLNAKYAMAWFAACAAIYLFATPDRRWILRDVRLYTAIAIAIAFIVPNILWNLDYSFATLSHTADNANWGAKLGNPAKAAEFFLAQFGVFGPILFASLIMITWRAWKDGLPETDRYLLAFALPIILIITMQAFLSRAHANWAAVSYIAATLLVTATMIRDLAWRWLTTSFVIHLTAIVLLAVGMATAGRIALPLAKDPFARTLGWREIADATKAELKAARQAGKPYGAVISDDRALAAELLYYMRDEKTPLRAWRHRARPRDHFELMRPFKGAAPEPYLLVSLRGANSSIPDAFASARPLVTKELPAGQNAKRTVSFFTLSGFKAN